MGNELKRVTVKSTLPQRPDKGYPLALFDRNEAYEGGEIYIADDKAHDVPLTTAVKAAINEGRLVEVDDEESVSESTGATGTNVDVNAITNPSLVSGTGTRAANNAVANELQPKAETATQEKQIFVNRDDDSVETLTGRYNAEQLKTLADQEGVDVSDARNKSEVAELILAKDAE